MLSRLLWADNQIRSVFDICASGLPSSRVAAPILFPANLQLLIKGVRCCRDDFPVAGQPPGFLSFLNQGLVGQRADEFAVFLRIKFL